MNSLPCHIGIGSLSCNPPISFGKRYSCGRRKWLRRAVDLDDVAVGIEEEELGETGGASGMLIKKRGACLEDG
jgi:hypothetical protein